MREGVESQSEAGHESGGRFRINLKASKSLGKAMLRVKRNKLGKILYQRACSGVIRLCDNLHAIRVKSASALF